MSLQVAKHFFTVTEFERMGAAGIFSEDARLELIEGEIVEISPIGSRHAGCVLFLSRFLNRAVGGAYQVAAQVKRNEQAQSQTISSLSIPASMILG